MSPVPAVFFDLDDTLIDDGGSALLCRERTCLELQTSVPGLDRRRLVREYTERARTYWLHRASSGLEDMRLISREMWAESLVACGYAGDSLAIDFEAVYNRLRRETVITFPEVVEVLEVLRLTHRFAVITNGDGANQRRRLQLAGLDAYFDVVIASTDLNAGKPDRVVFDAALDATGADRELAWHVGDNLLTDVGGALGAGLRAVWLNRHAAQRPAGHAEPHAEIASLRELPALLGPK